MTTPLLVCNPKANYLAHKKEIERAISRVLERGEYILGPEVAFFEKNFAAYVGVRFAVGVGNGTEALYLALRACGIGQGDEVITVSHSAVATVAAIELCGAIPVLVDINLDTYTIEPSCIEPAITKRTKAIIPVHLYGHPADMQNIMHIAQRHGLRVIEDCAQSAGAQYANQKTGAWGDISAFSFYPTKNLGAMGDAGMVMTDDAGLAERLRLLREYGWRQRYISDIPGLNSRLDELQAAILNVKLQYLDAENRKRQELATAYAQELSSSGLTLPVCIPKARHVYHQYVVRLDHRDSLKEFLRRKKIGTLIHYTLPVHRQPAYQGRLRCAGSMINTEEAAAEVLSLPMYPELSLEQIQQVAKTIMSWKQSKIV